MECPTTTSSVTPENGSDQPRRLDAGCWAELQRIQEEYAIAYEADVARYLQIIPELPVSGQDTTLVQHEVVVVSDVANNALSVFEPLSFFHEPNNDEARHASVEPAAFTERVTSSYVKKSRRIGALLARHA